jgi:hypothetical protein
LTAVDSFALETPLVTTRWPHHGPEAAYLKPGVNAEITPDDLNTYALTCGDLLDDPDRLAALRAGCRAHAAKYEMETMVTNFGQGVLGALAAKRR